jgi:hypothetical protein
VPHSHLLQLLFGNSGNVALLPDFWKDPTDGTAAGWILWIDFFSADFSSSSSSSSSLAQNSADDFLAVDVSTDCGEATAAEGGYGAGTTAAGWWGGRGWWGWGADEDYFGGGLWCAVSSLL